MKRSALKWLLPLLAVVLNLGGGPMALAQLAPVGQSGASHEVVQAGETVADVSEHCSGTEADRNGKSAPKHGGPEGCCAAGACHCSCPSALGMSLSPSPAVYERPLAPADAIRTQVASPRYGRILRPPIS